jgi:Ser/Thr protein kinase RdoA (MazF antagonist)
LNSVPVQRLLARTCPGCEATDLGGIMSLNIKLSCLQRVLRIHQPFVSRRWLRAVQEVRRCLAERGLVVPVALPLGRSTVFVCDDRLAEWESYIAHERLQPSPESYRWLFGAMGTLHHALKAIDVSVPQPAVATYAPPGSLRRWLKVTMPAVSHDPEAAEVASLLADLVKCLCKYWVPARKLPVQLVHGDVRLSNVCRTVEGNTVYLDFGFMAYRPRIHDLAYALVFMLLAQNTAQMPGDIDWQFIHGLIDEYEQTAQTRLVAVEWQALVPAMAAVPLYAAALDGFTEDPAGKLRGRLRFLRLSESLLAHPRC